MGTRSVTRIHDGDKNSPVLVAIYQQFDGYFESVGQELVDFCKDMTIVNGIGAGQPARIANGMGCFAAQLIAHLKTEKGVGGVYITSIDDEQEFNYDIYLTGERPNMFDETRTLVVEGKGYEESKILFGKVKKARKKSENKVV